VPDLTGIDPRIRPLLHDMLQPRPEDRPESLAAVAAWTVRTRRPGGARRLALAAAGLAGLGVLGAGAFAGWPAIEGAIHGLTHAGRAETARAPADEPPALAAAGQGGAGSPGQSGDRQPGSDQAGWTAETALGAVPPVLQPPAPLLTPAPPPVPEPVLQASPQLSPPPALASPAAPEPPPMQQAAIPPVAIPRSPLRRTSLRR
jgi:serine/threonine-protein kinase